jgi:glycosyltransferase involved in cell wall biosynthesis
MISIVAITFNEEEHIRHWYENHKELADEFIIIDTGSNDDTVKIAQELGIIVHHERWNHNFADMKNKAIRYCNEDWILFLSPDFYIDKENFEIIKEATKSKRYVAFATPMVHEKVVWIYERRQKQIPVKNINQDNHIILFRNDPRIEYRHRVHENIKDSVIEKFGESYIGKLPIIRRHDSTRNHGMGKAKLRYYNYLEDMAALERKIIEIGDDLRRDAYEEEING